MRRRLGGYRSLTAEQLVDLSTSLPGAGAPQGSAMADQWHAGLRALGYDVVDVIRARRWLRHGRPAGYRWDLS